MASRTVRAGVAALLAALLRGLVFLFHGTGGSASSFAERVEAVAVINHLVAQG